MAQRIAGALGGAGGGAVEAMAARMAALVKKIRKKTNIGREVFDPIWFGRPRPRRPVVIKHIHKTGKTAPSTLAKKWARMDAGKPWRLPSRGWGGSWSRRTTQDPSYPTGTRAQRRKWRREDRGN